MKLIFNLLLAVCLSACALSPNTPQKDIIKDVQKRKSTIVIDGELKLQYHTKGEYYVMDFITIGENYITFNKRASELITIHIRYAGEEGAIIGRDYHFDDDTHKLSHFYSLKNNHLHGFAVFYNDARKVERYEYFNEEKVGIHNSRMPILLVKSIKKYFRTASSTHYSQDEGMEIYTRIIL
jgi:hypothetical protein